MKKTIFFLALLFTLISCNSNTAHIGKWSGTVLMVQANYQFNNDGVFTAETYSSNNIMIGGGVGHYTLEEENLSLKYEKKYVYDSQSDVGEWMEDDKELNFHIELSGNKMTLVRQGSGIKMELQRN